MPSDSSVTRQFHLRRAARIERRLSGLGLRPGPLIRSLRTQKCRECCEEWLTLQGAEATNTKAWEKLHEGRVRRSRSSVKELASDGALGERVEDVPHFFVLRLQIALKGLERLDLGGDPFDHIYPAELQRLDLLRVVGH